MVSTVGHVVKEENKGRGCGGQSELHYRGEKMRGNTKGEIWKDKDIKWENAVYEMRIEEVKPKREFVVCG